MKKPKKIFKLFLISPKLKYRHIGNQKEMSQMLGKKTFIVSQALPIIAALTPDHYDIRIINEDIEDMPKKIKPDLVGITTLVSTSSRAYEIGDHFRSMGVPVVMGGPYTSFNTDEVLEHADSVVIGEAEVSWGQTLSDFENNKLKKIYSSSKNIEFKKNVFPRWDLVDTKNVMAFGVQATRGCPFNCEFCLVPKMYGTKVRFRDIENVVEEIKALPSKRFYFIDDNLTINKSYAKRLMKELIPLGVSWVCQSSIDVADDDELLDLMAEAGCFHILIGFESINPKSLTETKKFHNKVSQYETAIQKIHSSGIHVLASFVVGFDNDTIEEFDRFYEFILKNNISFILPNILTVSPGTDLYVRMKKEGRLYDIESSFINGAFPCMHYQNISQMDIFNKYYETIEKLFSFDTLRQKALNVLLNGKFNKNWTYDVGFFEKVQTSFVLLKKYFFTTNKDKKRLFKELFSLGLQKKIAVDKIVVYLLSMAGFEEYSKFTKTYLDDIREKIKLVDKGPWKDQVKK